MSVLFLNLRLLLILLQSLCSKLGPDEYDYIHLILLSGGPNSSVVDLNSWLLSIKACALSHASEEPYFHVSITNTFVPWSRCTGPWTRGDSAFIIWGINAQTMLFRSPLLFSTLGLAVYCETRSDLDIRLGPPHFQSSGLCFSARGHHTEGQIVSVPVPGAITITIKWSQFQG